MHDIRSSTIRSFIGPTIEVSTTILGRGGLVYPKGPYRTVTEYFAAYKLRELAYVLSKGHSTSFIDAIAIPCDLLDNFCLHHGDFEARNILVVDGQITSVLDWSFAGFYPQSTFFMTGLESLGEDRLMPLISKYVPAGKGAITRLDNTFRLGVFVEDAPNEQINT
jgi:phosphotransferase family enzyme